MTKTKFFDTSESNYLASSKLSLKNVNRIYWKNTWCLLFAITQTLFYFKFLQTSLIIKELIKSGTKFSRKVFHVQENSENWFSEFSYFKVFQGHFAVVYTMKLTCNKYFMKRSERNTSEFILAFAMNRLRRYDTISVHIVLGTFS